MLAGNVFAWKLRNSHLDIKSNITQETMLAAQKQVPNIKRDTPIEVPIHIIIRTGKIRDGFPTKRQNVCPKSAPLKDTYLQPKICHVVDSS